MALCERVIADVRLGLIADIGAQAVLQLEAAAAAGGVARTGG